jgi:hypothetical protein
MDTETKVYFEKLDQRLEAMGNGVASMEDRMAAKDDLQEIRDGLVMVLASKADLDEVNDNLSRKIDRLDARTDQDIRAIIKDIALLKQAQFGY